MCSRVDRPFSVEVFDVAPRCLFENHAQTKRLAFQSMDSPHVHRRTPFIYFSIRNQLYLERSTKPGDTKPPGSLNTVKLEHGGLAKGGEDSKSRNV